MAHPVVLARKETARFKWSPNPVPLALLVRVDEGALDRPSHIEYRPADIPVDIECAICEYAHMDAEYFAYRFMLGAWSMGNYSINGRMIDLETASFVRYRGPYTTASSKHRENVFGYEGLGFVRILRQLADIKGIKHIDAEERFFEERQKHLACCLLSLLGVDEAPGDAFLSRHQDYVMALSDQFEKLGKKICPAKTNMNLYAPVPEREDPSLLDMSNLFRNLGELYASAHDREEKALGYLIRKKALGRVRPDVVYELCSMPNNGQAHPSEVFIKERAVITHDRLEEFLDETKYFVHVLFQLIDMLDTEKCLPHSSYWRDRLKMMNQDFLPMHELNNVLLYWVEGYRSGGIDAETLGIEIEKLISLPHYPTGRNMYLENVPLFNYANLTQRELQHVDSHVKIIDFRKGETIIHAGQNVDSLHILMQGNCAIMVDGQKSSAIRDKGALIGEAAVIADGKNLNADVIAETPVRMLQIHKNDMTAIIAAHPELKRLLANIAAQKKEGAADKIITLPLFNGITPEDMRLFLADKAREKKFRKGEQIISQDEQNTVVYFLIRGSVVLIQSTTGSEIERIELKDMPLTEGMFGERSVLFDQKAICAVVANEDVITWFITNDDFMELLYLHPQLLRNVLDYISDYSRSNDHRIALVSEFKRKLSNQTISF